MSGNPREYSAVRKPAIASNELGRRHRQRPPNRQAAELNGIVVERSVRRRARLIACQKRCANQDTNRWFVMLRPPLSVRFPHIFDLETWNFWHKGQQKRRGFAVRYIRRDLPKDACREVRHHRDFSRGRANAQPSFNRSCAPTPPPVGEFRSAQCT